MNQLNVMCKHVLYTVQWNPSIAYTLGTKIFVRCPYLRGGGEYYEFSYMKVGLVLALIQECPLRGVLMQLFVSHHCMCATQL